MYSTYIIKSQNFNRYYIGSTEDFENRLNQHNNGQVISTKKFRPWVSVYKENFLTRTEARKREIQIKSYKGGQAFKKLLIRAGTQAVNEDRL